MKPAIPYIAFPGTCKEAMLHYQRVFGGEITTMQTMGDSGMGFPDEMNAMIFNSELVAGDLVLKASDNPSGADVGSSISVFVTFADQESQTRTFAELSDGGEVIFPITDNFGMCSDRFGVQWMLVYQG
ncbi:MAG: VOC family protein [Acidimicrobiales bacterium]